MKTIQLIPITLLTVLALTACSNRNHSSSTEAIAGKYQLVTVDGKSIPAEVSHGATAIRVVSGQMDFDADRNCTSLTVFGPIGGEPIVRKVFATYTHDQQEVDLVWHGAGRTRGTLGKDSFTMNNEGMIFYYQRIAPAE